MNIFFYYNRHRIVYCNILFDVSYDCIRNKNSLYIYPKIELIL